MSLFLFKNPKNSLRSWEPGIGNDLGARLSLPSPRAHFYLEDHMSNLIKSSQKALITVSNKKKAITTSVMVAAHFKKRHDNVIRDIEELIKKGLLNFEESNYLNRQKKIQPMYEMDRTGFTLLAMGFTGDKALEFKIKYIQAFDAMEAALIKQRDESVRLSYESKMVQFDDMFNKRFESIMKKMDQKIDNVNYGVACLKQSFDGFIKKSDSDWKELANGWKEMNKFSTELIKIIA